MEITSFEIAEQFTPDWFILRQGRFTASNAWKLMTDPRSKEAKESGELSETANTYVLEKVWESLSGSTTTGIDNAATQWGVEQEPNCKKWYTKITGNEVKECGLFETREVNVLASPDGLVNYDGLIECKAPFNGSIHLKHCFITNDEYFKSNHKEYYWQMQTQMLVTGRLWCDFVSFDPRIESNLGLFIYRLNRNETDIKLLIDKVNNATIIFNEYKKLFTK